MKFPYSWLKEILPTRHSPKEMADLLTSIGLEVEGIGEDEVIEVSLTPNLSHCASVVGTAREASAILEEKLNLPQSKVTECDSSIENATAVTVEAKEACPRYACRVIKGVKVGPSPDWLAKRVEACGIRSVNNVVDITNYVLLEWGHPLHAFDLNTLSGKQIIVRFAKKDEQITTLDEKERSPSTETLLICDAKKPIAIAGVMGSAETEVTEKTTDVLLEAAYFEPTQVRRASKRLGLSTEASKRFERGTDPNLVLTALDRAAALIQEHAGGNVLRGTLDVKEREFPPHTVTCRLSRIGKILGVQLGLSEVETIFTRLGLKVLSTEEETFTVEVPTFRNDIHHEIDLIEEVARLYGYDNLIQEKRPPYRTGALPHNKAFLFEREIRAHLLGEGLHEFLTCNLISPSQADLVAPDCMPQRSLIKLLNPSSIEQSVLRPSLLPNMLQVVKYNADHDILSLAGFEVGRVHFKSKENYLEPSVVSLVMTGKRTFHHWGSKPGTVDFFDLKGVVENFLGKLKVSTPRFVPSNYENFHPGRQAEVIIDDTPVGIMGEVHPHTLAKADLKHAVLFAELNVEDLQGLVKELGSMSPLPHYPASARDWTLTLSNLCPISDVFDLIENEKSPLLETISLLDVYESEKLGTEWKNVTFSFLYRDSKKTLSLEEVETEHKRITSNVEKQLKGKVKP